MPPTCDLFCTVVDNFGDLGIAWRLGRQLAAEHDVRVRLWIDALPPFARLRPQLDPTLDRQTLDGIEVRLWRDPLPEVEPGDIVVALLGCRLPEDWLVRMAARSPQPVWLNLEHLSAEDWVEGVHGLPSPHPRLPLTQHFFMPGFTPKTGGLLREGDLLARRDRFQNDPDERGRFWQRLGIAEEHPQELRVSLFGYENRALPELLAAWATGDRPMRVLLPEGKLLPQVSSWFGATLHKGMVRSRGHLALHVLPMLDPDDYDRLLWGCDLNFVRSEDSFVRAQWAGRPMIWQPYRQEEQAHSAKLEAFLSRYLLEGLAPEDRSAALQLCRGWNAEEGVAAAWPGFLARIAPISAHAQNWSAHLADQIDLAENLMLFCRPWLKSAPI